MKWLILPIVFILGINSQAQIITTFAGNGIYGDTTVAFPATLAKIGYPRGITVDDTGNVYFTDEGHSVIKKVNTSGILSTFCRQWRSRL